MAHFSLNHLSSLICCHPSRFESSDYFCSNLLNKFINNHDNNRENDPNETTLQRQFAQNRQDLILNHASARPVNSAPYYYGDIAYRQPFTRYTNHSDISNINLLNSNGDWNRASIKYSIMDGLRVGIKNQVRQSNQYLRSPNVNRSDEFNVSLRGWLYRLEGAAIKQWKRRWCVLADYCLFYYKDMAEEKMLGSLLLPSYKISPCFSSDGISRKFAFKAEHNNMKTYYFSADSKEIQQQWMNALSMASIMQLSAIFSAQTNNVQHQQNNNNLTNHDPSNNQINTNDPHDHNNNDERKESISDRRLGPLSTSSVQDDESGFIAYHQTKRLEDSNVVQQLQQQPIYPINNYDGQNFLPTAAMYQQMAYNGSMRLPIYYPNHPHHHHIHSQLNNGEYINAPPKPQRHYYDLMLPYDLQDHHHHHQHQTYKIYHGQMDPNFINQNYFIIANEQNFMPYHTDISSDFNYVPQQQQSHANQFDHDCFNQNVEHSHQQRLQLEQLQRLPPRPHSADFLERNQDYELDDEECETLFASNNNNKSGDSFNNDIVNQDSRIMPIRPKSSIEKYDNYHHNGKGSYVSYNENYQSKFDPYMAKNFYQTSHNDNADNSIIPVSLKKTNIVDKLNNAHIVTDTTTIPNRPPLPQEYVFRFQQQNTEHTQNIDDLVGLPKTQSTSIKREKNITTYTSDDENSLHQVPIETSKKKRRKRKSRENLNNASDSEIQFTDEKGKSNTFDRASRKYFLKSSRRFSVSAAEYVGRRHEELILMLIQLRRKQSQLAKTCEKLRLQMDSEEKMMEIEPYRKDDYQLRFNELSRKWKEVNREYRLQIPIIQTIDHMIKIKSKTKLNELNKKKAASTSILDRVTVDDDQFNLVKKDRDSVSSDSDSIRTAETPNENIEILKRQQKVLEGELDRVRGMLTHSTRKLEEKAVENARMEQEMLLARNKLKQVLENEQEAMEITRSSKLEAELVHINKVIDDLHNRRKELNNAIENLKNSETKFMADRFNDDNVYSDYHKFTNEELKMAVNNAAETSLYPLYENIKKSQAFLSNQNSLQIDHRHVEDDNDGDNDNEDDDNFDRTNNNNLNDEFFTLNINLDKHHTNLSSTSRISTNLNEINNNFPSNIQTMCEFDPNKVMTMTYGGDSIVDQQLKQIYNYHHQPVIIQQPSTKSNEVKTVREVKRESERRKFNHHQQQRTSTSSYNIVRTNYDSYLQTNHYFNHNDNAMTTELKSIDQQMKFDTDTVIDHLTSSPSQNFNTPDIVQSTIKLTDKT
ncbi:pleckstrin homology domain-containing family A member kramer isoform X5 [Dermatophagoides farinae]|uniref:pleckstrin homology domain-containing family A member kramer isoform X5 n=1 Tax=Dermatophagoides farinae TaxID=6954 RepID=UPI003F62B990